MLPGTTLSLATAAHIYPPEIVRAARTRGRKPLPICTGDVRLLLVRLSAGTEELAEGLAAIVSNHAAAGGASGGARLSD